MLCDTGGVFVCTHAIEIGSVFLPLIANMLFVSINFSLEKVFVKFPARLCEF